MENCKLLEICTAQMRLIITGCSGTIVVDVAICFENYTFVKQSVRLNVQVI